MARPHPESISRTAHYTGYVWYANGHSHAAFATLTGRVLYRALRGPNVAAHAIGRGTLDGMLLARHRLIDLRLAQAINAGEVSQIVEIGAGLSPRGWRFRTRYGNAVTYVEADLPGIIEHKRRILAELGGETAHHHTVEIDAQRDEGPASIDAICASLDRKRGTAIITEGLINYFDRATVAGMWGRFAHALSTFSSGLYLSDILLRANNRGPLATGFGVLLGMFVRGRVHVDFADGPDVEATLASAGLDGVVLDPRDFTFELPNLETAGARHVRIIEAMPG